MKGWTRHEPGWYTHDALGGICHELDGWWHYPLNGDPHGPFATLGLTLDAIAEKVGVEKEEEK